MFKFIQIRMDLNDDIELFKAEVPTHFAQVILPFATPKPYTFHIPDEMLEKVTNGRIPAKFG